MLDLELHFDDLVKNYGVLEAMYNMDHRPVTENYKQHMKAQLEFDFPNIKSCSIMQHSKWNNHHYLPVHEDFSTMEEKCPRVLYRSTRKFENGCPDYPAEMCEEFFKELLFVKNLDKIRAVVEERAARFNDLKSRGLLETCECCLNEEVLPEDMLQCSSGHRYCNSCVGEMTAIAVGQAKGRVSCLNADCAEQYALHAIKKCVDAKTFSHVVHRLQQEEIRAAEIENLVECPFCDFATIVDDVTVTVYRCLNPLCMKESCRLCKHINHFPLSCEKYSEERQVDLRTRVENEMSEAVIRCCYKCNRHFLRTDGCPVMTCICGAQMCYICKQPRGRRIYCGCRNMDTELLHKQELEEAYWAARELYFQREYEGENIIEKLGIDKLLDKPQGSLLQEAAA